MRDLELEDDRLDQTQRESGTAVHDVVGSNVLEVDTLLAFCGAGQPLSGENLKELDEHLAIAEVDVEVGDLAVDPHKVFLHMLSLVCKSFDPALLEEVGARVVFVLLPVQGVPPGTDADVGRHGSPTTSETDPDLL